MRDPGNPDTNWNEFNHQKDVSQKKKHDNV